MTEKAATPRNPVGRAIVLFLRTLWTVSCGVYHTIEPARISILVSMLAIVAFWFVPQGKDILVGFAEDDGLLKTLGFFASLTYLCLANWYWPRFLLSFHFVGVHSRGQLKRRTEDCLRLHVPRILGTLPALVVGIGFLITRAAKTVIDQVPQARLAHGLLAAGCFALAIVLYFAFVGRRRLLERRSAARKAARPVLLERRSAAGKAARRVLLERRVVAAKVARPKYSRLAELKRDGVALAGLALYSVPPLIFFLAFLFAPVPAGFALTSTSVVLLGLASVAFNGALLVYFGHRYGLPSLLLVGLLAGIASLNNDDHEVRALGQKPAPARPTIEDQLDAWQKNLTAVEHDRLPKTLFIVATEGGGIRAAYWTALVLSSLQDASIKNGTGVFSDHLFAISGVSGGSFGGATFSALVADPIEGAGGFAVRSKALMDRDFLAPLVGRMLTTDLLQRFIPIPIPSFDRGAPFEEAWELAWKDSKVSTPESDLFAASIGRFSKPPLRKLGWTPALFLNGTNVETGGRIITSSCSCEDPDAETFVEAIDGVKEAVHETRLSTAAHSSARFTYFNPPGRYPDGTHVVDGGYFDNSGGATARDILARLRRYNDAKGAKIVPYLIIIRNGVVEEKPVDLSHNHAVSEVLAPIEALWNTRTAHADLSLAELESQSVLATVKSGIQVSSFYLYGNTVPLGWSLSEQSMGEMTGQINDEISGPNGQKLFQALSPAK